MHNYLISNETARVTAQPFIILHSAKVNLVGQQQDSHYFLTHYYFSGYFKKDVLSTNSFVLLNPLHYTSLADGHAPCCDQWNTTPRPEATLLEQPHCL